MGEHIRRALNFVTGPTTRIFGIWGMLWPVVIGTVFFAVLLGVAAEGMLQGALLPLPSWEFFKYGFSVEGPLLLLAGAVVQTVLASRRSQNDQQQQDEQSKQMTLPELQAKAKKDAASKRLDRWDVFGWGLVTTGALLSFLATFPWSLPVVQ